MFIPGLKPGEFTTRIKISGGTFGMRMKPIDHLSGRSYYKKKQATTITLIVAGLTVAAVIFYFTNKNLGFYLAVKSGVSNFEKNKFTDAMSDFNKALNIKPNAPEAIDGLGLIYVKQGDFEKAQQTYSQAITSGLKSNRYINHTKYGNQYLDMGAYKNAEMEFSQAVRLSSTDSKALYGLGCSFQAYGDLDRAISYYTKALTYSPKFTQARKNLSVAEDDKNKGAIYYLFDKNSEPLARQNLIAAEGKKTYLLDQKAAHITGFDSDKRGKTGLEAELAAYLPGNKIYLTIDSQLQQAVSRSMGWYKGSIVVLDPSTGAILALYSQPTFRPNAIDKNWWDYNGNSNKPLLNRATDRLYEPGSIAKIITVAAAYENAVKESSVFPVKCAGSTMFDGKAFWCSDKHGRINSIEKTIDTSCNIGTAFLGFSVGSPALTEYDMRFGFNTLFDIGFTDAIRKTEISIPVQKSLSPANDPDRFSIAMHACGLSPDRKNQFLITPLHAAMLSATIANDGIMMNPYLVKEIRNVNGKLLYQAVPKELKRPVSPATAEKIKALMIDAVEKGIGQKAKVKGISIAGKTGTSNGANNSLNAWFISFAPAEKPQYAIAILCEGEGKGMTVAAPIAGEIYKGIFK